MRQVDRFSSAFASHAVLGSLPPSPPRAGAYVALSSSSPDDDDDHFSPSESPTSPTSPSSLFLSPPHSHLRAFSEIPPASPTIEGTFAPAFPSSLPPQPNARRTRNFQRGILCALAALAVTSLWLLSGGEGVLTGLTGFSSFSLGEGTRTTQPACSAREFSTGKWVPKLPSLIPNETVVDVLEASGFEGATQSWFKPAWFFGSKESNWLEMGEQRWKAAQWMWESESEVCRSEIETARAENLIRDLVERGGWMVLGDSLSEQHFFSLGCTLFPHVDVRWGAGWWEQLMYLRRDSPLIPSLNLPPSFDFDLTPLIANIRTDHGFTQAELLDIYEATPQALTTPSSSIFTTYPVQSPPVRDYLDRFFGVGEIYNTTDSKENYHALVYSTAAHFTVREFAFSEGQAAIEPLFEAVSRNWTALVREYLEKDAGGREVVVRAASSGHEECRDYFEPFEEGKVPTPTSYNWAEIPLMNDAFETVVNETANPQLSFLSLDTLALLRPDAHSADCLHFAVGTGVFEGWTDYLSYFLRPR